MTDTQADTAPGLSKGGPQEAYAKIETALQRTPRGRWFLAEYARRNRNADTALVLTAMERLERVVKGGVEISEPVPPAASEGPALPFERLKQEAKAAAHDVAAMEQASKDAAADILLATEAIQDFSWDMREKGIDRKTCETIERHTADIYAACSFQDVVYQRKENALHLLRLMAETLEDALGGAAPAKDASKATPGREDFAAPATGGSPLSWAGEPEPEIPLAPEFVAEGEVSDLIDDMPAQATEPSPEPSEDPAGMAVPSRREEPSPDALNAPVSQHAVNEDLNRLEATRLAVLFG